MPAEPRRPSPAPLGRCPVFVAAGTILPLGPEKSEETGDLTLRVYPGAAASLTLFDDDGESTLDPTRVALPVAPRRRGRRADGRARRRLDAALADAALRDAGRVKPLSVRFGGKTVTSVTTAEVPMTALAALAKRDGA